MKKGKWIAQIRMQIFNMNPEEFARLLRMETGEKINGKKLDSNAVQRFEKWGSKDTKGKIKDFVEPPKKIVDFLETICQSPAGVKISVGNSSKSINENKTSTEDYPNIVNNPQYFCFPANYDPTSILRNFINLFRTSDAEFTVRVISDAQPGGIENAKVRAFLDWNDEEPMGDAVWTDSNGYATLRHKKSKSIITVPRLYVRANLLGYWNYCGEGIELRNDRPTPINLEPLEIPHSEELVPQFFSREIPFDSSQFNRIKVGVIDTGIEERQDLNLQGGTAFFYHDDDPERAADENLYGDNGSGHGTHVAGIIGSTDTQILGIAPGVPLFSYRMFPESILGETPFRGTRSLAPTNFEKALQKAIEDKCDIINISVEFVGKSSRRVRNLLRRAYEEGILVVAAAGNKRAKSVSEPANLSTVVAVSSFGKENTIPNSTASLRQLGNPISTEDESIRFARFSNYGKKGHLFIAPGIGIISTIVGGKFGVMDGTSMSVPIITGVVVRLLSSNPDIIDMPRNHNRTEQIIEMLESAALNMGFTTEYQGKGMPCFSE